MAICSRWRASKRVSTALVMNAAHAQEHEREPDRENLQHPDFVRDPDMRGMVAAAIRAPAPIGGQEPIQFGDDRPFLGARSQC